MLLDRERLLQDSITPATLPAVQVCHSLALAALPALQAHKTSIDLAFITSHATANKQV